MKMPDPMPYSTNCNVSGCWSENVKARIEQTPVANNYVTEGVPTSNIETDITSSNNPTINQNPNLNPVNNISDDVYNPMSGLGDISEFG